MDTQLIGALTSLADKALTFALLLYFVMYFKTQAEKSNTELIEHLKRHEETDKLA